MLPPEVDLLNARIREVPTLRTEADEPATGRELLVARKRMLAPLLAAHARGASLAVAWVRGAGRPVQVLVGTTEPVQEVPGPLDRFVLDFPAGAIATLLSPGLGRKTLESLPHWLVCETTFEPPGDQPGELPGGLDLDEIMADLAQTSVAWLVVARPVQRAGIQSRLDEMSLTVAELEKHREARGGKRIEFERAESELRYFERWATMGLWAVEIWAGASSHRDALTVAALFGASADLDDLPVRVRPAGQQGSRRQAPAYTTSAEVLAALTRPPCRELPGVRVVDVPAFDITPETTGPLPLGQVLDSRLRPCGPLGVRLETVNRHVFVTGATGSGKSQTTRTLLEALAAAGVPWLVIEPAKAEYRKMAGRLAGIGQRVTVLTLGSPSDPPVGLNPLAPSSASVGGRRLSFPLQTHVDLVKALFSASFEAEEPFPQILSAALTRCYEELDWNLVSGQPASGSSASARYPSLADLQAAALAVVEEVGYGREIADNVRGFITVRINSLRLGTPGRFFEGGHPLDLEALLARNAVLEIQDVGDDRDKAFVIGTMLIRIYETIRLQAELDSDDLSHVIVLEEAHRLLRRTRPGDASHHAVQQFADLLAEVRAYGEGIIVAEQIPTKIAEEVVKNSALKIMHRLPSTDDRRFVGDTMNLSDRQSQSVVALLPGRAAVHADGMDRPILVQIDDHRSAEVRAVATEAPPARHRSRSCPSWCSTRPCNLAELEAHAELARDPLFEVWIELAVLAHISGRVLPSPDATWLRAIEGQGHDPLRCALGLAVDAGVTGRWSVLQRYYPPSDLAEHLTTVLSGSLRGSPSACTQEVQWQAGRFRWADVATALNAHQGSPDPHPLTDKWKTRGLVLPERPVREQYQELLRRLERSRDSYTTLVWGAHGALQRSLLRLSSAATDAGRIHHALALLGISAQWPVTILTWAGAEPSGSRGSG